MKVISVVNQKGGCGKTITAVNLSAALARSGAKILLIDLDPQAHATFHLRKENRLTITDILESAAPEGDNLSLAQAHVYVSENFFFIPSSIGLAALEHKIAGRQDRLKILSAFLQSYCRQFDYVIIDCAPNLGLITLNALSASQYALIPINLCDFSLRGVEILKNILIMLKDFNGASPVPFYLLTQIDRRSRFAVQFMQKVREQLGSQLLESGIRLNTYLREAASVGKNIFEYNPLSRGAQDFNSLAGEITTIANRQGSWTPLFLKGADFNEVYVAGDFNNWQKEPRFKLNKIAGNLWSINLALEKGRYRYKFVSGDNDWFVDPHNNLVENDPFGGSNSLLVID